MVANGDKVAQDFCLSMLQNKVRGLQDQCRDKDADPDNMEFDYNTKEELGRILNLADVLPFHSHY